jgi:phage baseplate assembly protein W
VAGMTEERQRLFGDDLELYSRNETYDLRPNGAGDLGLAHGNENIVQALTLRLRVRRGDLAPLGWPAYGSRLHELIGEPNINRVHVRLMAYARSAIEEDPRVAEVMEVSASPSGRDMVRLTMDIRLIEEPNPLNLVFDFDLEGA